MLTDTLGMAVPTPLSPTRAGEFSRQRKRLNEKAKWTESVHSIIGATMYQCVAQANGKSSVLFDLGFNKTLDLLTTRQLELVFRDEQPVVHVGESVFYERVIFTRAQPADCRPRSSRSACTSSHTCSVDPCARG